MAKTKQQKELLVANVTNMLKDAKGGVFADFNGLTVKEMSELRGLFKGENIDFEVLKKTLLSKSLEQTPVTGLGSDEFKSSVSLATSANDEVVAAKILVDFAKKHDKLQVLGGVVNHSFINSNQVKSLAKLPGKQQLIGQVVGTIAAPLRGLVGVLQGNLRSLVQVLSAISKKA